MSTFILFDCLQLFSLDCLFSGKNRLYPAYSVSSSETDDSPVHNNNKTSTNISSNTAKSLQYNFQDDNIKVGRNFGWTDDNVKVGRTSPPPTLSTSSHHQYTLNYKQSLTQQQQQKGANTASAIGLNQTAKVENTTKSKGDGQTNDWTYVLCKIVVLIGFLSEFFEKKLK